MTAMLRYLLRGKRGLIAVVLCSAAAQLIYAIAAFSCYLLPGIAHVHANIQELGMSMSWNDYIDGYGGFIRGDTMEIISLTVLTLWFLLLCGHAFRISMANGVSRRSLIGTLLISSFVSSAAATVINQGLKLILVYKIGYIFDTSLYTRLFKSGYNSIGNAKYVISTLSPSLDVRAALLYFGAAFLLLLTVCALYALYRRYEMTGVLCGILAVTVVCLAYSEIRSAIRKITESIHNVFYDKDAVIVLIDGIETPLIQPKGVPMIVSAAAAAAVCIAVFVITMKKTAIRPVSRR